MEGFRPLRRWLSPEFAGRQLDAIRRVREVVSEVKPDAVVGFGGYLSAVGVLAARRAGIPAVIHEQNVLPGGSNRWVARFCGAVAVSFPETARHFQRHPRVEVTGNPIRLTPGQRDPAEARRHFGFDAERPVLLVMGGSQGSRAINSLTLGMWEERPPEDRRRVQVLHLAGPSAEQVEAAYHRLGMDHRVYPFLHEMDLALSAATLAISRAGATGITEMAAFGVPALLVPYPYAKRHQLANARWMERAGGAAVLEEPGLTPRRLWESVSGLLWDARRLEGMGRALRERADGAAVERLAGLVQQAAGVPARTPELVTA
jgi:UDP-N-acetylglucosamine--N-acetylmuramyl-(pentapeptide) pyrophosphoryl-undecaprenol N-acetylglucosamine transferase